jgi:hypothetical protein
MHGRTWLTVLRLCLAAWLGFVGVLGMSGKPFVIPHTVVPTAVAKPPQQAACVAERMAPRPTSSEVGSVGPDETKAVLETARWLLIGTSLAVTGTSSVVLFSTAARASAPAGATAAASWSASDRPAFMAHALLWFWATLGDSGACPRRATSLSRRGASCPLLTSLIGAHDGC